MITNYSDVLGNIDVNAQVNTLHIGKNVNRIIFSNIAERRIKLILSAPQNGFVAFDLWPGFSVLCLCEPSIIKYPTNRTSAFSKLLIHTYSDQVQLRIIPNTQHPSCTVFVTVSFSSVPPSLQNLAKSVVRAHTAQTRHGNLSVQYFEHISTSFHLCEIIAEPFRQIKLELQTAGGTLFTCTHLSCTCYEHCQMCTEQAHHCATNAIGTGPQVSKITQNVMCYTLFNC